MPIRNWNEFKEFTKWYWTHRYVKIALAIAGLLFLIGIIEILFIR